MKRLRTAACVTATVVVFLVPTRLFALEDTLVVYANGPTLDQIVLADTLANGNQAHDVYQLVSLDTTYLFDATITVNDNVAFIGVPDPGTKRLPCIQPDVLSDNSVPGVFFALTGKGTQAVFKNLYLLGIAINNTVNYGEGQGIQVSADSIRLTVDNMVFEQMSQFAIGYSGDWDKFFITNSKFRNMTTLPNQWYVGELLRNENYIGAFKTDSIVIQNNTMLCVSGYATAATGGIVNYYEFSHNNVVFTFKNPFFLDRMVNAKFNDNLFYCAYAGGQNKTEYAGWDSFTPDTGPSIILMGPLDSTTAALLLGHASTGAGDPAAELLRKVEVKNNVYFWPPELTAFWTAWNDTAHTDSIYLPLWMNPPTVAMFADNTQWPGFEESGTQNVDPAFGASIDAVLNSGVGNGNGLLEWFTGVRRGTGTTETYGYQTTQVGTAADWVPPWPLPETSDMQYTNAALKTGATDGGPIGDPNWFGTSTDVEPSGGTTPRSFSLSQNYPNPFNPSTKINFSIPVAAQVQVKIYDLLGEEIATLADELMKPGEYTATFDASRFASGVYVYRIVAGDFVHSKKMILLK
jgi:Secretion system C-terminal sorting domain